MRKVFYAHFLCFQHICENAIELAICYPQHPRLPIKREDDPTYILHFFDHVDGGCFAMRKRLQGSRRQSYKARVRYANQSSLSAALCVLFKILKSVKVAAIYLDIPSLSPDVERVLRDQPPNSIMCELFALNTLHRALFPVLLPLVAPGCSLYTYPYSGRKSKRIFVDSSFFDFEVVRLLPPLFLKSATNIIVLIGARCSSVSV
ncbi:hypothetical protein OESDEN_18075 [Oesophagostomum dentatum]|uniref:Uncharacterized protein n=1 Tax=Oesophagostomum dentatum TaxID=61180 RepID=A0A0B1SAB5_OESDE|nr:hypothetical protein OESDEN_18075 [Oesophagostomum dentatum]